GRRSSRRSSAHARPRARVGMGVAAERVKSKWPTVRRRATPPTRSRVPELPEVESVRRSLVRARLRAPVRSVWRSEHALRTGELWRDERLSLLRRATPLRWERRGKHLLWRLRSAAGDAVGLLVHLG